MSRSSLRGFHSMAFLLLLSYYGSLGVLAQNTSTSTAAAVNTIPANDQCLTSIPIQVNATAVLGTTVGATESTSCVGTHAGIWYSTIGTGNVMTMSTCGPGTTTAATKVALHEADCATTTTRCVRTVRSNAEFVVPCDNPLGHVVTWDSTWNQLYRFLIYPSEPGTTGGGPVEVSVVDYAAPSNNACSNAALLVPGDAVTTGSTLYAIPQYSCRGSGGDRRGVFYNFFGDGHVMTISTCHEDATDFRTALAVQTSCDSSCIRSVDAGVATTACDSSDQQFGTIFTLDTQAGTVYTVVVHGVNTKDVGNYGVSLTSYAPPPNNACQQALPVTVNSDVVAVGTTVNSTLQYSCRGRGGQRRGSWWNFLGTGRVMTISTCHSPTNYESKLALHTACDSYCVETEDPGFDVPCDSLFGSSLTFDSVLGQAYQVLVFGSTNAKVGDYGLSIVDYAPPANNLCTAATPLVVNGDAVTGTTINATKQYSCRGRGGSRRGVWYTFVGSGQVMTVSTCHAQTDFTAQIGLHTACDSYCTENMNPGFDIDCDNPFGKTMTFDSTAGQIYSIIVFGTSNSNVGNFAVSVRDYTAPSNNGCSKAATVLVNGPVVPSSTLNSTQHYSCRGSGGSRRGVWYSTVGTGNIMTATTCHAVTDYQSRVAVQTNCQSYCIQDEDPGFQVPCGNPNGRSITFDSVEGTIYQFLVYGSSNSEIGNFGLQVIDYQSPPNDHCTRPRPLTLNARPVGGSTINATKSSHNCGGPSRGTWYLVQSDRDQTLSATTCSSDTNFATRISVMTACSSGCVRSTYSGGDTSCPGNALAWRSTWEAKAGLDYYLIVYGATNTEIGDFAIAVQDETFAGTYSPTVSPSPTTSPTLTPAGTLAPSINRGAVIDVPSLLVTSEPAATSTPTSTPASTGQSPLTTMVPASSGEVPFNDECSRADILQVNFDMVTGSTINATLDSVCGNDNIQRRGVYFVLLGNGRPLSVSTCSSVTDFPTRITVQTSCTSDCFAIFSEEDPTCDQKPASALGRSVANPNAWKTTFSSVQNELYYILVHGESDYDSGIFGIQVTDDTYLTSTAAFSPTPSPSYTSAPTNTNVPTPYSPSNATTGANGGAVGDGALAQDTINIIVFVVIMLLMLCIALCFGYNRGYAELDNFEDAETAMREFRKDIMEKKILVITRPKGYVPCCCKRNDIFGVNENKFAWESKSYALFYSTRIKRRWKPLATYLQFLFGWLSFASTIVAVFLPTNIFNNVIGGCALFLNELLLHMWYGYLRYPNISWAGLDIDGKGDGLFENMRNLFSILYHNGSDEDHWNPWIDWLCFPCVLIMHMASIIGLVVSFCMCGILDLIEDDDGQAKRRRRRRRRHGYMAEEKEDKDRNGAVAFAAMFGALLGSFAYPILFVVAVNPVWKVVAAYAHHVVEEYYEAKLFRRSMKEFLIKTAFSILSDFVGIDGLDALQDELDDELEQYGVTEDHLEQGGNIAEAVDECLEELPAPDVRPANFNGDAPPRRTDQTESEDEEYFYDEDSSDGGADDGADEEFGEDENFSSEEEGHDNVNDDDGDEVADDEEETYFLDSEEEDDEAQEKFSNERDEQLPLRGRPSR